MKAIRVHQFGGPEMLKFEDVPDPKPGSAQVLISVRAIGVNPVETYIRSGIYGPKQFPYIPGTDVGGVVEEVGQNVKQFKKGDRVYTNSSVSGAYAQKVVCEISQVHPLPENVSFEQGAAMGVPYATAYRALFLRGQIRPSETILIHGASGGVGTAAVQLAHAHGAVVIGTGGTEEGRKLVKQQGADHVLDHHSPDYLKQLMTLTDNRGVDAIVELLANVNLAKDLTVLAKYGRVIVVGNRGSIEINPRDTMSRDASILGMSLMNASEAELKQIHAGLVAGLASGTLLPVIGREMPLSDAAKAHEQILKPGSHGKIVLKP
ncbi:MAG TPA: NADPH:quinone reductase [Tepidisphaeraceae bacterium]|nr:NADPH:quinone reductase [Tepidisphaeraceae bacterium]